MLPPSPLTDPDVQISRFRFLTGELRSQRCSNDPIRDSSVKKRSCQFSYPLPFRGQVCETQSSLPCCPPAVLSSRRPPSLDRVPVSPVPRRHQYYEGATTSHPRIPAHLSLRFRGPRDSFSVRARPCRCAPAWTRVGSLRFPGDPSCAFAPVYDPGRTDAPRQGGLTGAAPASRK